jgi:hypothetical protein
MLLDFAAVAIVVPSIWIVDAAAGPGKHFVDLPAAVAAAQSGDTLIVRPGFCAPFTVSGKALTIRGAGVLLSGGTTVQTGFFAPPGSGVTVIDAVPAGQTFFLDGISFRPGFSTQAYGEMLKISGATSNVVLADCEVRGYVTNHGDGLAVDGAAVHAVRSSFRGGAAASASSGGNGYGGDGAEVRNGGVLTSDDCDFTGGIGGSPFFAGAIAGSGVRVTGGRAELRRSSL